MRACVPKIGPGGSVSQQLVHVLKAGSVSSCACKHGGLSALLGGRPAALCTALPSAALLLAAVPSQLLVTQWSIHVELQARQYRSRGVPDYLLPHHLKRMHSPR